MIITDKDIDEKTLREKDERTMEYFDQLADLQKKYDELNNFSNSQCVKLLKENAILKSQIEKMKDCMTCIHNLDSQYFCTCDLGPEEQSKCCYKNNRDKWELAE